MVPIRFLDSSDEMSGRDPRPSSRLAEPDRHVGFAGKLDLRPVLGESACIVPEGLKTNVPSTGVIVMSQVSITSAWSVERVVLARPGAARRPTPWGVSLPK